MRARGGAIKMQWILMLMRMLVKAVCYWLTGGGYLHAGSVVCRRYASYLAECVELARRARSRDKIVSAVKANYYAAVLLSGLCAPVPAGAARVSARLPLVLAKAENACRFAAVLDLFFIQPIEI